MIVLKCTAVVDITRKRPNVHKRGSLFRMRNGLKLRTLIMGANMMGAKIGNEKNVIYGHRYNICGRWIVAT